jgi:hypothetical protein
LSNPGKRRHRLKHLKETAVLHITRLIALASLMLAAAAASIRLARAIRRVM